MSFLSPSNFNQNYDINNEGLLGAAINAQGEKLLYYNVVFHKEFDVVELKQELINFAKS